MVKNDDSAKPRRQSARTAKKRLVNQTTQDPATPQKSAEPSMQTKKIRKVVAKTAASKVKQNGKPQKSKTPKSKPKGSTSAKTKTKAVAAVAQSSEKATVKEVVNLSQAQRLQKLTQYSPMPLSKFAKLVQQEIFQLKTRKAGDEVICPICQCEMFENVDYVDNASVSAACKAQEEGLTPADYVVVMGRCKDHGYHLECLQAQLGDRNFLDCSTCMVTYGVKTGDQPPGTMSWSKEPRQCDGFPHGTSTWVIKYSFAAGIHPETKHQFHGDSRTGYIPDTEEGREVLALLVLCFRRRMTFTVGFSVVRGRDNCIVWNGVHHKTRTHGGSTHYGYPDETYFNRVKQELALKAVIFESEADKQCQVKQVTSELSFLKVGKTSSVTQANFSTGFKIPGF